MKVYLKQNVFQAALERIRFLFDEFENIIVNISGGKDSTVCLNLALRVAKEKNRLPLTVLFIDQEAEWQIVIEHIRTIMYDTDDVEPRWLQVPIKLFNSTSYDEPWLYCWDPEKENDWIREKESISLKENIYGTERFAQMFSKFMLKEFPHNKACYIAGVRAEESPARYVTLTSIEKYKHITWAKTLNKKREHFTFYPIYDWSYTDVWKAINDNSWPYCQLYDLMYQYGVPVRDMRISNVHHETATRSLYFLQEIESDTWDALTKRLHGINTAGKMKQDAFRVSDLPYMFESWREYRDYLLDKLVTDSAIKKRYAEKFEKMDRKYRDLRYGDSLFKAEINTILANDYHFTKLNNWERSPSIHSFRDFKSKGIKGKHTEQYEHLL